MKRLGFEFKETMAGTYTRLGQQGEPAAIRIHARVHVPDAVQHVRDGMAELEGTLDMEQFADDVPIAGTLEIALLTKRMIRYDFTFLGNDGSPYRFTGQKNVRMADLLGTMTTLVGSITDSLGEEIARATLRFDLRADFLPFLVSWKPAMAG